MTKKFIATVKLRIKTNIMKFLFFNWKAKIKFMTIHGDGRSIYVYKVKEILDLIVGRVLLILTKISHCLL